MIVPVKASGWFNTPMSDVERTALIRSGLAPTNDVLYPFWGRRANVSLFYGGRGGGKSEAVFDRLINNCINDNYFNCYYGRKVWETIHESCFETLIECIKKQGKKHLFHFSEASNSSMIVRCLANGNKFQPFGANKPDKLKSIKDPSHLVFEEFDQFDLKDIQDIFPTLRTEKAICELIAMFNTWGVRDNHWIFKLFFPDKYRGDDQNQYDLLENIEVAHYFVNYTDNHFINQEEYRKRLRLAAGGSDLVFESLANGAWGVEPNNNPWLFAFKHEKHVKPTPLLQAYPVYLSFDFNNDPFACVAMQASEMKGDSNSFIHFIREFVGAVKVEDMCQQIKAAFPASILYVTGDRSGQNEDLGRNQTLYQIIAGLLNINPRSQLNLNTANITHADSRLLCNAMFNNYPHLSIDPSCRNLVADCQIAKPDPNSKVASQLLKDRGIYKLDAFDAMRYHFQTYFNEWAKKVYFRVLKK